MYYSVLTEDSTNWIITHAGTKTSFQQVTLPDFWWGAVLIHPFKLGILYAEMHWICSACKRPDWVTSTTKTQAEADPCPGSLFTPTTHHQQKTEQHISLAWKKINLQSSKYTLDRYIDFTLSLSQKFAHEASTRLEWCDFFLVSSLKQLDLSKCLQLIAYILGALLFIPTYWSKSRTRSASYFIDKTARSTKT